MAEKKKGIEDLNEISKELEEACENVVKAIKKIRKYDVNKSSKGDES